MTKFLCVLLALAISSFIFDLFNNRDLLMIADALFIFSIICIMWGVRELERINKMITKIEKKMNK